MKILFVDDSGAQRFIQKKIFQDNGVDVENIEEVSNGALAMEKVSGNTDYALIILDWNMPEMNGITFLKKIRGEGNKTPIVMVTSESDPGMIAEAKEAGVTNFVSKPLQADKFWEVVKEFVS